MKKKYPYKNLSDTLLRLKDQVIESIPFCYQLTSGINSPEQLYENLKFITSYKSDPKNVELIQTAETLINNNWHGVSGQGDCDCLTVLSLACLYCINENNLFLILAGNSIYAPTHVYSGFIKNGSFFDFDLTNDTFNKTRKYKFNQFLKFKI